MTRRRRFLSLSVLCTLASACLPGGRPPDFAAPRRGAGLGVRGGPEGANKGPFAVVFAGPEGEDIAHPEPSLVFSRPVRALGQPPNEPALKAHFTPPVAGKWVWVGSSGARFVAEGDFQESTEYTLEVEAGLRALDGSTLEAPVHLRFATPRPVLYGDGNHEDNTEADQKLWVRFSQILSREEVERGLRVTGQSGLPLPFTIEQNGKTWGDTVLVVPREEWPPGETIRVALAAGIRGTLGSLPTAREQASTYAIRPLPSIESIDCSREEDGRCSHHALITIQVTEPVRPSELRPLVRVTPALRLTYENDAKDDSPRSWFSFSAPFETDKAYTIEVIPPAPSTRARAPSRPAKKGGKGARKPPETRPITGGASAEVRFAPETPSVIYSFGGTYLPLSEKAELGAAASFTDQASVSGKRLDPDTIVALAAAPDHDKAAAQLPGWQSVALSTDIRGLNRWASLAPAAPTGPGAFLFLSRWKGLAGERTSTQVLQRTDLALTTRATPDTTLVWVTRLSTGAPAAGVQVEVRDGQGHQSAGLTDRDGLLDLPTPGFGATTPHKKGESSGEQEARAPREGWRIVFAREGDDLVYLRTSAPRAARMNALLYTDRGLYRPGNTVQIKGYVRRPTTAGLESPEGLPVRLHIDEPNGQGRDLDEKLSAWGSLAHPIELSADAAVGYYRATLFDEHDTQLAVVSFQVEEFHPTSFRATSRLDRESFIRGDTATCTVQSRYLYGGSMEGARVRWEMERQAAYFRIPGLLDYELGEEGRRLPSRSSDDGGQTYLDKAGQVVLTRRLDNTDQRGPEQLVCDVSVWDANWESFATTSTALVHPGEVYVAMQRPGRRQLAPGETITPKVLTPTPEGRLRAMPVRLELWHEFREIEGVQAPAKLIGSCEMTTGDKAGGCALRAPATAADPDDHFVVRASTRDGRGNEIRSGLRFYPTSERRRPVTPPRPKPRKEPKRKPELEMKLPEGTLASGQTLKVALRSPFPESHALVTVERHAVIEHRVLTLDQEATTVELPLTDADAPWVNVSTVAVAPSSDGLTSRHYEQVSGRVNVTPTPRELDVKIRPSKTETMPGEDLEVEVEVSQGDGTPARAEVTLYAADEGTLLLANYHRPEPLDPLYNSRSLTVQGQQTRDSLGWAYDWKAALERGGSGIGFGTGFGSGHGRLGGSHMSKSPQVRMGATTVERPRRDFRQLALFLPDLVTDEQGRVKAHFTIPDSLTTYRLMAVAVTKGDQAGSAETALTTSKPLQVRPSVPHVIRVGDRFEVVANVANNGHDAIEADVSLRSPALEPAAPPPIHVRVGGGERTTVSFPVAAQTAQIAELTVEVKGGQTSDTAVERIEIVTPLAAETQSIYGQTDAAVVEQLGDLSRVRGDVGGLEVMLASSPLAGLGAGLDQLIDYPYGCTEQTVSRLVPLLSLRPLAAAANVTLPPDLDVVAQQAVDHVLRNQTRDGGFALWPGMEKSIDWVTTYAVWGLTEAQRHGAKVSRSSLDRARALLAEQVLRWSASNREAALATQALDVLASDPGTAPPGLVLVASQLFAHRAELPAFARAGLLHAMAQLHAPQDEQAALIKDIEGSLRLDGPLVRAALRDDRYLDLLDSDVRTSALTLRALLVAAPDHPLLAGLAMGLLADRKGGTWRTTQETTWALLALDAYRVARLGAPVQVDASVSLGDETTPTMTAHFAGPAGAILREQRAFWPMATLRSHSPADLTLRAEGGAAFYQARLRFYPLALPTEPLSVGLEVRRRYLVIPQSRTAAEDRTSWQTPTTSIPEGSFVWVQLDLIASGPRRYVVLDDPLPGGLEAVNTRLHGGAQWLRSLEMGSPSRLERRDDRVVFFFDDLAAGPHTVGYVAHATRKGSYVTPPAHAEEMYTPETMGRTEALSISVITAPPPPKPATP